MKETFLSNLTKEQKEIYRLLQFFMRYSNTGVLVFFQEVNYPDAETVFLMKQAKDIDEYKKRHSGKLPESVHVSGGSYKPYAESVVDVADSVAHKFRKFGGIENFFAAFEELSKTSSRNMNILRDLSRRAGSLETIADIAEKNYLSDPQITNIKNRTLKALAINISARRGKQ